MNVLSAYTMPALKVEVAQFVDRLLGMSSKYIVRNQKSIASENSQFVQ